MRSGASLFDELLTHRATQVPVIEVIRNLKQAFHRMKALLLCLPIVRTTDSKQNFILETDARTVKLSAVLEQALPDTRLEHPVGFFSRGCTDT